MGSAPQDEILRLAAARRGHFLLESGHHGDLWLDLELLCLDPQRIQPLATELAHRLVPLNVEVVCGPLIEGAFVAFLVAAELGRQFCYTERFKRPKTDGLFPVGYSLPPPLRKIVRQRRVAIVNDVTNAGSAVRGSFEDLEACGAEIVGIATLLTLGSAAQEFATSKGVAFETLAQLPNNLWMPADCPLCAGGIPLEALLPQITP